MVEISIYDSNTRNYAVYHTDGVVRIGNYDAVPRVLGFQPFQGIRVEATGNATKIGHDDVPHGVIVDGFAAETKPVLQHEHSPVVSFLGRGVQIMFWIMVFNWMFGKGKQK